MMKRLFVVLLLCLTAVSVHAQDEFTLIDALENDPDQRFTSLLTALNTTGLTALLENGEFTLLAPTSGAFRTLADSLEIEEDELLADADLLGDVLPYHLLNGSVLFADIEALSQERNDGLASIRTVSGQRIRLQVDINANTALINDGAASFVELNLEADNGIIHVINNVLLPTGAASTNDDTDMATLPDPTATEEALFANGEPSGNIVEILAESNEFTVLAAALEAASLTEILTDPDPDRQWTLFAPTDEAFGKALVSIGISEDDLLENDLLDEILLYHLFDEVLTTEELSGRNGDYTATQLAGGAVLFTVIGEDEDVQVTLNGIVDVLQADIIADNGVIHAIDNVLLPIEALEAFGF
jgi:transforming growth factor-beta-induced protein